MMTNVNGYGKFEQIIDIIHSENNERSKEILRLRFIDGLVIREIAARYDISLVRVNQIIAKSLRIIKNDFRLKEII